MSKVLIEPHISPLSPWEFFRKVSPTASFFLDSAGVQGRGASYSYIGFTPFCEAVLQRKTLKVSGSHSGRYRAADIFPVFRRILRAHTARPEPRRPFFTGGAVGFLGYEMAPFFEKLRLRKKPHPGTPDLYFGFYSELAVYDHKARIYYLVARAGTTAQAKEKIRKLRAYFEAPASAKPEKKFRMKAFRPGISREKFESMVRGAKRYIEAGDIYQANLSQRFSFNFDGAENGLYEALRRINPSPFACFLRMKNMSVLSSSPERLVSKRGNLCETRPIAGTRPRGPGREKELLANPKERAEHVMLVDLERNDLGRVCDYRSVRVSEMMTVEKYSHVMHLVSKITGTLSKDRDGWDLLRAMFPGGTVTGCPKVRCMEIIDELEPVQRGLYTGSIGYFGFNGDLDFNIVIRTLVLHKKKGYLQVGAGIVYDSDPGREYEETLHKGEALVAAMARAVS